MQQKAPEAELKYIPCHQLQPGRYQPRKIFDELSLKELAESIQSQGLIQPIVVRSITPNSYEIIAGERRWRAAQLINFSEVRCLVEYCSEEEAALKATIENINRVDLNPIEEARAYQRLMDEFHYTQEKVAKNVGKPRSKVANLLRLLRLDSRVQLLLVNGELNEGHGKVLAGIDSYRQFSLAMKCVQQGLSVRGLENELKNQVTKVEEQIISYTRDVDVERLEQAVGETLGAPVKIKQNSDPKSGKIEIQFYNLEILQGLLEKMGVDYEA